MTLYYAYYNDTTVLGLPNNSKSGDNIDFYFTNKSDIKKVIKHHVKTRWWLKDIRENTVVKNIEENV